MGYLLLFGNLHHPHGGREGYFRTEPLFEEHSEPCQRLHIDTIYGQRQ